MNPETTGMEDLRSRVVMLEHRITEFVPRFATMEAWKAQKDVSDAEIRILLTNLMEGVRGIKGGIGKLIWLVVGAIVVIVVAWIMSGGMKSAVQTASASLKSSPSVTVGSLECPVEKPIFVSSYCRSRPIVASR